MIEISKEALIISPIEQKIQKILLDLDEQLIDVGIRVCGVRVDTRNFANMNVEIHTVKRQSQK